MLKDEQMLNSLQLLRQEYLCPISRQVMRNPVIDCQGVSYEKVHIQKWFQSNNISPVTGQELSSKFLIPNYYLQDLINKVQAQIPKILSFHQLLKNQIHSLKLENQKQFNQRDLNPVNQPNQQFQAHFQNYKEQMIDQQDKNQKIISNNNINSMVIHETKKLFHLQSNSNQIKNHSNNNNQEINKQHQSNGNYQNQEKIMSHLEKRKFIKKSNFERFYSNKVSQNLKTMKKDWQKHLQNVTFSHAQMIKKYKKSLKQKEQQLQKYKQTINQRSFKQPQLNNNSTNKYQLSQSNQNQILHKIQELKMQLKAYILHKYYPLPENVKEKSQCLNTIQNSIKKTVVNLQKKDENNDQSRLRSTQEQQMNNKLRSQIKGYQFEMSKLLDQIYMSKKQLQSNKKIADQQKFVLNFNHHKQIQELFLIIKQDKINIKTLRAQLKKKIQKKTLFYSKKYIQLIPTNNQTPPPKNQSNLPEKQKQQILLQFKQNHKIWTIIFYIYAKQVKKLDLIDDKFKKILDEQGQTYHNEIYEGRIFNKKLGLIWKTLQNASVKSLLQTFRVYDKQSNKMIDYGYEIQAGSLWQILQKFNERETYWRQILCISSVNFTIDNGEWRVLVRNGYLYPNLIEINLVGCEIEDVEWKDFSRWEGLRKVSFEGNPLSDKSRDQLKEYKKCNPNVEVIF